MQSLFNLLDRGFEKEFLQANHSLKNAVFISTFLFFVGCVLTTASSLSLEIRYSYLTGLQYTSIGLAILTLLSLIGFLYTLFKPDTTNHLKKSCLVWTFLFFGSMVLTILGSLISSSSATYCGYFISYNGEIDGDYIIDSIETQYSCTYLNYSENIQYQISQASYSAISTYCKGNAQCGVSSTLTVKKWIRVFGFQLSAVILGVGTFVLFLFLAYKIISKLKQLGLEEKVHTQVCDQKPKEIISIQQQKIPQVFGQTNQNAGYNSIPYQGLQSMPLIQTQSPISNQRQQVQVQQPIQKNPYTKNLSQQNQLQENLMNNNNNFQQVETDEFAQKNN